ncbi:phosphate signaling complex protein PhoU [Caldisalinibacter kiritimatiensis]|uniref:Phosphate-specific transport system accessory protein PhoU n=1 Tax=Caldisalinibacter kiritimatiensis TaxID=1304284 RepID=R1CGQ6_9FIRM|nr:phosphate signaling complex protein PhoU [Caldisalinibacter kiritimatiensis]EOD01470.1 Phosphate transport system regulatory protein PhoU [Caldisalinibacter kiritimatiensis]
MREAFEQQLKELEKSLLKMGAMVEDAIDLALKALVNQDLEMADKVIELDDKIDIIEVQIEQKCLELIALQQPKAIDLRRISTVLKIITDLERIGDHGVNIANITKKIGKEKFIKPLIDIPKMADVARSMVKKSLDSFVNEDLELANEVAEMDDIVDDIYEDIYVELLQMLTEDKTIMEQVMHLLLIGRYLERIGDHTTNICERIHYMVTGERVVY